MIELHIDRFDVPLVGWYNAIILLRHILKFLNGEMDLTIAQFSVPYNPYAVNGLLLDYDCGVEFLRMRVGKQGFIVTDADVSNRVSKPPQAYARSTLWTK